ncbi:hypothetical protein CRG98_007369 [Punica granatum]|uniref:Non-haem dioxygenase N-terminal domain-containing protein n=1 Tax=Punica granatum TaxID=22663 RepID=A0A2I0KUU6_PUNGR|nr:hypothetical protein CRG98_007369 [Punica granatum]
MTLHLQSNSYPPPFRRHSPVPQPQPSYVSGSPARKLDDDSGTDPIPVVDLGSLDQGELREACRGWGLFRLVNHGVPQTLLTMLQEHVGRLFSLPFEAKQQGLFGSPLSYFWGTPALTPSGSALGMGPGQDRINWVEGLNAPLGQLSQLRAHDPLLASFRHAGAKQAPTCPPVTPPGAYEPRIWLCHKRLQNKSWRSDLGSLRSDLVSWTQEQSWESPGVDGFKRSAVAGGGHKRGVMKEA